MIILKSFIIQLMIENSLSVPRSFPHNRNMMKEESILRLIQKHISADITTTRPQGRDSQDFHEAYISSLVDLVRDAFEAGRDRGYDEGMEAAQDMAVQYAQELGE